jgi:hypothetical protein
VEVEPFALRVCVSTIVVEDGDNGGSIIKGMIGSKNNDEDSRHGGGDGVDDMNGGGEGVKGGGEGVKGDGEGVDDMDGGAEERGGGILRSASLITVRSWCLILVLSFNF